MSLYNGFVVPCCFTQPTMDYSISLIMSFYALSGSLGVAQNQLYSQACSGLVAVCYHFLHL